MGDQDRYIPGVPRLGRHQPAGPEAAVAFYGGLFGWEFQDVTSPGAPVRYFLALLRGGPVAGIASQPEEGAACGGLSVADADETAAKVRAAGGSVLSEPADVGETGRTALCADPDGAAFCLWQANEHRGAAIVNEPGSLNFNHLNTRDLDRAHAFYGAVFGWSSLISAAATPGRSPATATG